MKHRNANNHPKKKRFLQLSGGVDPETLEELFESIKAVMINSGAKITGIAFEFGYTEVSTSHQQPLLFDRTKLKKYERPLLPGFSGRVWIRYGAKIKNTWGSSAFEPTLIYTGTGGFSYSGPWQDVARAKYNLLRMISSGGTRTLKIKGCSVPDDYLQTYSYEYRFFIADFPKLQETMNQMAVVQQLGGEDIPYMKKSYFLWNDPDTKAFDQLIIEEDQLLYPVVPSAKLLGMVGVD